ncbi:MAG: SPOR domain-containing protein [Rhodocyclaceae bacterium]
MRLLVFLLVAANLVFFAWMQGYLGERENPDAVRLTQQLQADKLRVLSRDEAPQILPPIVAAPAKPPPEKCLAWRDLALATADQVESMLAERFAGLRRARHVIPEASSWWVFIPPQANKAEADKKAGELKRLGAPEFFVVQEPGPNRFAVSLGIFSSEQAAEERLASLRGKGVKSAKVGLRTVISPEQLTLEATGPVPMLEEARTAVQQQLPDIKTAACGNS